MAGVELLCLMVFTVLVQETCAATTEQYYWASTYPDSTSSYPCDETAYSNTGVIESPNYPLSYYNNLRCTYRIRTSTNIQLKVDDIDLEQGSDTLHFRYSTPTGERSTWLDRTDQGFVMVGQNFEITFRTDQSVTRKGFQLSWRPELFNYDLTTSGYNTDSWPATRDYWGTTAGYLNTECGGDYIVTYAVLESPGYPGTYHQNNRCVYTVNSPVDVLLEVTNLNLELGYDTLEITRDYEAPNPSLHLTLSGGLNDTSAWSGRQFRIVFKSDGSNEYSEGFRIVVRPVSSPPVYGTTSQYGSGTEGYWTTASSLPERCGGDYIAREGVIESPNYPENYTNNADCWFEVYPGTRVRIHLDCYDLESGYDYLQLFGNSGWPIWNVTGSYNSDLDVTHVGHFRVHFHSDSSVQRQGFRLTWQQTSGRGYTTESWWTPTRSWYTTDSWWTPTRSWWPYTTASGRGYTTESWWTPTRSWYTTDSWWTPTRSWWPYTTGPGDRITVNCNSKDLSVAVPRDIIRQVFPGVSEYDLTLNNPNCRGQVYSDVVIFRSSILGCGMTREETMYEVVYENRISAPSTQTTVPPYYWSYTTPPPRGAAITRFDSPDIKVECRLDNYATAVGFYRPQHNQELVARGHGNFTVYMDFYRDYNYNYKITSYPISLALNEDVFVDLRLDAGDSTLEIAAQSCYAVATYDGYHTFSDVHYLIMNGCPYDSTVSLEYSPSNHYHFRFRTFEFLKNKDQVYIFCGVKACNDTDYYNRCHRNCNSRYRRDTTEDEEHDFSIFQGPLKFRDKRNTDLHAAEKGNTKVNSASGSVAAVVMAVSAVAMVIASVVMVIIWRKRKQTVSRGEDRII